MPELPEVETVRRGLAQTLEGRRIARVMLRRKDLRVPFPDGFAKTLEGRRIEAVRRRAKYLLWEMEGGRTLIAHLGMSGRFGLHADTPKAYMKHDHAVFHLDDGQALVFNDPRRFGLMTIAPTQTLAAHPLLAGLGFEPLGRRFTQTALAVLLHGRKQPVKVALMDQRNVVGVGNIYASEACFRAGLHPAMPSAKAAEKSDALVKSVRDVLREAINSGGSSLRDFWHVDGGGGYFQHRFDVYGRAGKPCKRCKTPIIQLKMAGRSTFFCPRCQVK